MTRIPNHFRRLRDDAARSFEAGIAAVAGTAAVRRALTIASDPGLIFGNTLISRTSSLRVVAIGKAACPMAKGAAAVPGALLVDPCLAVAPHGAAWAVPRFEVLSAAHPLPDAASERAALEVERHVSRARPGDALLLLLSGGASSLVAAPPPGISGDDLRRTWEVLYRSGAGIEEVNRVRRRLSRLASGGLARAAAPARVHALVMSDVRPGRPEVVGSGPVSRDDGPDGDARDVLVGLGLWLEVPESVRRRLEAPREPAPAVDATIEVVASNAEAVDAAAAALRERGYAVERDDTWLEGEAREAGRRLAERLRSCTSPRGALVAGGETTVSVTGSGRGGRAQELGLSAALSLEDDPPPAGLAWVLLAGGTDGRDGPTDSAGALVDAGTVRRAAAAGRDARADLARNDSYAALAAAGDHLRVGATGTHVADLHVLLWEMAPPPGDAAVTDPSPTPGSL